jgi:general secretion pathway protein D
MTEIRRFLGPRLLVYMLSAVFVLSTIAKDKASDPALAKALEAEREGDYDQALGFIKEALTKKPADIAYQLEERRIRFEYGAIHVHHALGVREAGHLKEALAEFELALKIDPSSAIAEQEIRRTREMIERGPTASGAQAALTPAETGKLEEMRRIASMAGAPELRPLSHDPINLRMTNRPKILFATVGNLAGINVIFDPDYETQNTIRQQTVELSNASLQQALDYVAVLTKSFWKPMSDNAIFVTLDNRQKRQDYEDLVVKVFYLKNATQQAELTEAVTLLRTVADIQKVFQSTPLNAIVVRAEADKVRLAEKIIAAIDKPKSEVVVDVLVMEVNRNYTRNLAAAFGASGINSTITFTPRAGIAGEASAASSSSGSTSNNTLLLANVKRISTADWTITNVPGALIQAILNNGETKVLQAPRLRAVDNFKATLKIGEKVPTATGSYSSGVSTTSTNALVSTQFTYLDVGVNMDLTPRVHDGKEVSMHVVIEVSQVSDYVTIGGISEPEIGQRRVELDLRMRDGEINLIGGLIKEEEDKTTTGIPGLAQIPFLKHFFTADNVTRTENELVITLVPHIVRSPEITELDLKEVLSGNSANVKVNTLQQDPRPRDK